MGMFDNITCQAALPFTPPASFAKDYDVKALTSNFQSKDTPDQALNQYRISKKGILSKLEIKGTYGKKKRLLKKDRNDFRKIMDAMPKFTETSRRWVRVNFTGDIRFYNGFNHKTGNASITYKGETFNEYTYGWIEFLALFDRGKLIKPIRLVRFSIPKRFSKKKLEEFYQDSMKYRKKNHVDPIDYNAGPQ